MTITRLKPAELYTKCDPKKFDFTTTAELPERLSALGQDRALSAVELGINIKSKGYNLFCLGPGRTAPDDASSNGETRPCGCCGHSVPYSGGTAPVPPP